MSEEHQPVPAQPLQLSYADRAEQYGIVLETWRGGLRIMIPPRILKFLPSVVIELDSTYLRFQGVTNEWDESGSLDRPRDRVYEVKFVAQTGKLFIKAHGFDFIECQPHPDHTVVQWIAEQLNEALGFTPSPPR